MVADHRVRQAIFAYMQDPEMMRLYQTSASFKLGVDDFFYRVIPTYLTGLAVTAAERDAQMEEAKQHMMRFASSPLIPLTDELAKTLGIDIVRPNKPS